MNIDATLRDQWTPTDGTWTLTLPAGWMQGRSAFGGLTAAAMAALARRNVPDDTRRLRSSSVQLLAPAVPGEVRGTSEVLREGRNITFVETRLYQGDTLVGRATQVFAKVIESSIEVSAPPCPETPDPESLPALPYLEGITPEFTQHVDMRWATGRPPFMGSTEAAFTGLFRYRVTLGGAEGMLALLDSWPAPSLSLAKRPCPASTVTWNAHLIADPASFEDWFTMRYETVVGAHGLHTVVGHLYDGSKTLVGWSEQVVAIFG